MANGASVSYSITVRLELPGPADAPSASSPP